MKWCGLIRLRNGLTVDACGSYMP